MKKLLILIVACSVLLYFYPQPNLEAWYSAKKQASLFWFSDTFDTKARVNTDRILFDLKSKINHFTPKEQAKLEEIVSSIHSVNAFYTDFCVTTKRQYILRSTVQKDICKAISQYAHLL